MRARLIKAGIVGVGVSLVLIACGGDDQNAADELDGGGDHDGGQLDATTPDSGMGTVVDSGKMDSGSKDATVQDTGTGNQDSGEPDTGTTTRDSGSDSGSDSSTPEDAGHDAGHDAGVDAGEDGGVDSGVDAGVDSGVDSGIDAGSDAGDAGDSGAPAVTFLHPVQDGVINPGEYGVGLGGYSYVSGGVIWSMTWDDTNLYIGITGANIGEALVFYLDAKTGGLTTPYNSYDNVAPSSLQISADLVAYVKNGYNEYRVAGATAWSDPSVANMLPYADNGGTNTRELAIPWSATSGARPASFNFFGLITSGGGYIYGQVPVGNPASDQNSQHDTDPIVQWFNVPNTSVTDGPTAFSSVKP